MKKKISPLITLVAVSIISIYGCSSTNTITGGGSGVTQTGTVSIPSGASYAMSFKENVLAAVNSIFSPVANAITGMIPWSGSSVQMYVQGDYVGELLQLGNHQTNTDGSGNYSLPNVPQQFMIAKATKNGASLYSFIYPGTVIGGNITPESTGAMQLLAATITYIDYSKIDASIMSSLKNQLESSLTATFNANPSLIPDFGNANSVYTFVSNFTTNGFLTSGANWTAFQNALTNYQSKGLEYQIPTATIASFGGGTSTDWGSVPVFKTLRTGNSKYPLAGTDLQEIKLAKDATYFYIYVKTNSAPYTAVANKYLFTVGFGQAVPVNSVSYAIQYNGSAWVANGGYGSTNFSHYVGSNYIEYRVPLSSIPAIAVSGLQLFFQALAVDTTYLTSITNVNLDTSDAGYGLIKF